jgi:hypothetical protein
MRYREPLPADCPPDEAAEIAAERIVFRLVRGNPPALADFRSQRAERPTAAFRIPECLLRGLSVFAERADCERTRKLPRFRGSSVCRVRLGMGAGRIQQTFQPSHHTWWPFAEFDILTYCNLDKL